MEQFILQEAVAEAQIVVLDQLQQALDAADGAALATVFARARQAREQWIQGQPSLAAGALAAGARA